MSAEPASLIDWRRFPWDRFFRDHHQCSPAVFSGVLDQPIASPREAFAITRAGAEPTRTGRSARLRLHDGPRSVVTRGSLEPRASDRSVAGYLKRLERDGRSYGYIVNDAQAASAPLLARIGGFLDTLYTRSDMPIGGALLDLFAGRYRRPLLHPHKDGQDVFTFVVSGRKRFLAWPFDLLARRFAVPERHRFTSYTLPVAKLDALRSEAVVLEAGPEDIIYWPADWWHAADPTGSLVVTLGLGIYRRAIHLDHLFHAVELLREEEQRQGRASFAVSCDTLEYGRGPRLLAAALAVKRSAQAAVLASEELARQESIAHECWMSALGFRVVPAPRASFSLEESDRVRLAFPGAVRHLILGRELILCASGHALELPRHGRIRAFLERLEDGRPHTMRSLAREFSRGSARNEPTLAPEVIVHITRWLGRHHALVRLPTEAAVVG